MKAIKVRVEVADREEIWILPISRLVQVRWAGEEKPFLYLTFEDGLTLVALDSDKALLGEIDRALEVPSGTYALGGLWAVFSDI